MCVQSFDDSRGFAIRITYRISLRSSSLWEPRHPLLKVVPMVAFLLPFEGCLRAHGVLPRRFVNLSIPLCFMIPFGQYPLLCEDPFMEISPCYFLHGALLLVFLRAFSAPHYKSNTTSKISWSISVPRHVVPRCVCNRSFTHSHWGQISDRCGNDPSAGSPTETLLRLHLPLNDKVYTSSQQKHQ